MNIQTSKNVAYTTNELELSAKKKAKNNILGTKLNKLFTLKSHKSPKGRPWVIEVDVPLSPSYEFVTLSPREVTRNKNSLTEDTSESRIFESFLESSRKTESEGDENLSIDLSDVLNSKNSLVEGGDQAWRARKEFQNDQSLEYNFTEPDSIERSGDKKAIINEHISEYSKSESSHYSKSITTPKTTNGMTEGVQTDNYSPYGSDEPYSPTPQRIKFHIRSPSSITDNYEVLDQSHTSGAIPRYFYSQKVENMAVFLPNEPQQNKGASPKLKIKNFRNKGNTSPAFSAQDPTFSGANRRMSESTTGLDLSGEKSLVGSSNLVKYEKKVANEDYAKDFNYSCPATNVYTITKDEVSERSSEYLDGTFTNDQSKKFILNLDEMVLLTPTELSGRKEKVNRKHVVIQNSKDIEILVDERGISALENLKDLADERSYTDVFTVGESSLDGGGNDNANKHCSPIQKHIGFNSSLPYNMSSAKSAPCSVEKDQADAKYVRLVTSDKSIGKSYDSKVKQMAKEYMHNIGKINQHLGQVTDSKPPPESLKVSNKKKKEASPVNVTYRDNVFFKTVSQNTYEATVVGTGTGAKAFYNNISTLSETEKSYAIDLHSHGAGKTENALHVDGEEVGTYRKRATLVEEEFLSKFVCPNVSSVKVDPQYCKKGDKLNIDTAITNIVTKSDVNIGTHPWYTGMRSRDNTRKIVDVLNPDFFGERGDIKQPISNMYFSKNTSISKSEDQSKNPSVKITDKPLFGTIRDSCISKIGSEKIYDINNAKYSESKGIPFSDDTTFNSRNKLKANSSCPEFLLAKFEKLAINISSQKPTTKKELEYTQRNTRGSDEYNDEADDYDEGYNKTEFKDLSNGSRLLEMDPTLCELDHTPRIFPPRSLKLAEHSPKKQSDALNSSESRSGVKKLHFLDSLKEFEPSKDMDIHGNNSEFDSQSTDTKSSVYLQKSSYSGLNAYGSGSLLNQYNGHGSKYSLVKTSGTYSNPGYIQSAEMVSSKRAPLTTLPYLSSAVSFPTQNVNTHMIVDETNESHFSNAPTDLSLEFQPLKYDHHLVVDRLNSTRTEVSFNYEIEHAFQSSSIMGKSLIQRKIFKFYMRPIVVNIPHWIEIRIPRVYLKLQYISSFSFITTVKLWVNENRPLFNPYRFTRCFESILLSGSWLKKMPLVKRVEMVNVGLTRIPISLGRASQLKYLNLSRNWITEIECEFDFPPNLKFINISDNPLSKAAVLFLMNCNINNMYVYFGNEDRVLDTMLRSSTTRRFTNNEDVRLASLGSRSKNLSSKTFDSALRVGEMLSGDEYNALLPNSSKLYRYYERSRRHRERVLSKAELLASLDHVHKDFTDNYPSLSIGDTPDRIVRNAESQDSLIESFPLPCNFFTTPILDNEHYLKIKLVERLRRTLETRLKSHISNMKTHYSFSAYEKYANKVSMLSKIYLDLIYEISSSHNFFKKNSILIQRCRTGSNLRIDRTTSPKLNANAAHSYSFGKHV
ncbi:hypothetical protein AX774_g5157 [Zancudomyces culisetae]|uniref:Uncharacterized protein n=1 Tax=Zancudomyces culisetae TaxID=1213189 RepID=A0A1R1PK91_ZANCU|nr:hypothetical protein AX774_g5157 [Zancudomyces culisetae]|eukprot:OMH81388.1 hypothetical protein AX774_g5157 [Zancudomyces culisetae]